MGRWLPLCRYVQPTKVQILNGIIVDSKSKAAASYLLAAVYAPPNVDGNEVGKKPTIVRKNHHRRVTVGVKRFTVTKQSAHHTHLVPGYEPESLPNFV